MVYLFSSDHKTQLSSQICRAVSLYEQKIVEPDALSLSYGERGKPYFSSYPLHLSLSDSHGLRAVALSQGTVGVDLEWQKKRPFEKLSARYFSPEEQAFLHGGDADRFYSLWTAKEAYVKYTGTGIDHTFPQWSVLSLKEVILTSSVLENYRLALCLPPAHPFRAGIAFVDF